MSKLAKLFEGQELSEEFVTKATAIVEAEIKETETSLTEAYDTKVAELELQTEAKIQDEIIPSLEAMTESYIKDEVMPSVDKYLTATVNEWLEENKLSVESGLKVELAESFLSGMVGLVESHSFEVNTETVDLAESLKVEVTELTAKLNESIDSKIDTAKELEEMKKAKIVSEVSLELTESQKEKLVLVSESVSFKTEDQFESAMKDLLESYFPAGRETETIVESVVKNTEVITESHENSYLSSLTSGL